MRLPARNIILKKIIGNHVSQRELFFSKQQDANKYLGRYDAYISHAYRSKHYVVMSKSDRAYVISQYAGEEIDYLDSLKKFYSEYRLQSGYWIKRFEIKYEDNCNLDANGTLVTKAELEERHRKFDILMNEVQKAEAKYKSMSFVPDDVAKKIQSIC